MNAEDHDSGIETSLELRQDGTLHHRAGASSHFFDFFNDFPGITDDVGAVVDLEMSLSFNQFLFHSFRETCHDRQHDHEHCHPQDHTDQTGQCYQGNSAAPGAQMAQRQKNLSPHNRSTP